MKKLIASLLAIVMSVCLLFAFAGCNIDHITIITPDGNIDIDIIPGNDGENNNDNDNKKDENDDKEIDFSESTVSEGLEYAPSNDGTAYTVIGIGTFKGNNLVIPATHSEGADSKELPVTAIGEEAFATCLNLTSVVLPGSITELGMGAFGTNWTEGDGCTRLKGVNYLGDVADWCGIVFGNAYANPVFYAKHLYVNGELLTELTLPENLEAIRNYVFYNCAHIQGGLVIPETVTEIGIMAFYGCGGLTGKLVVPSSVRSLGGFAFSKCTGLTSLELPDRESLSLGDYEFETCSGLTSVTLGSGLSTISQGMFYGCSGLTSIVIPEGVTTIQQSFFYKCTQLKTITIPESVTWMDVDLNDNDGTVYLTDVYYNGSQAQWDQIEKVNLCVSWTQVIVDGELQQWGTLQPTLHFAK